MQNASGILYPPHGIIDGCIVISNKILPEIQAYLTITSMLEDRIMLVKRSIYMIDPQRGFLESCVSKEFHPPGRLTSQREIL